jgi:hypothetical protein
MPVSFTVGLEIIMETQRSPSIGLFLPASLFFIVLGWGGLFLLINITLPSIGPRWLMFFLLFIAVTGTALPFVAFLNRRFPSSPPVTGAIVLRQAIWFALYVSTLAWLQLGRVLTSSLALLLAVGLILIEVLLRIRERSQWKPG